MSVPSNIKRIKSTICVIHRLRRGSECKKFRHFLPWQPGQRWMNHCNTPSTGNSSRSLLSIAAVGRGTLGALTAARGACGVTIDLTAAGSGSAHSRTRCSQ